MATGLKVGLCVLFALVTIGGFGACCVTFCPPTRPEEDPTTNGSSNTYSQGQQHQQQVEFPIVPVETTTTPASTMSSHVQDEIMISSC